MTVRNGGLSELLRRQALGAEWLTVACDHLVREPALWAASRQISPRTGVFAEQIAREVWPRRSDAGDTATTGLSIVLAVMRAAETTSSGRPGADVPPRSAETRPLRELLALAELVPPLTVWTEEPVTVPAGLPQRGPRTAQLERRAESVARILGRQWCAEPGCLTPLEAPGVGEVSTSRGLARLPWGARLRCRAHEHLLDRTDDLEKVQLTLEGIARMHGRARAA